MVPQETEAHVPTLADGDFKFKSSELSALVIWEVGRYVTAPLTSTPRQSTVLSSTVLSLLMCLKTPKFLNSYPHNSHRLLTHGTASSFSRFE
jgi:hypothetical protein